MSTHITVFALLALTVSAERVIVGLPGDGASTALGSSIVVQIQKPVRSICTSPIP
jgi:hypothetical protein